jgi:ligand-binding sensor domain-containing protein
MRITILFFLFIISAIHISAQEYVSENAPMRVIHCTAITQDQNVKNIFVDDNNTKWAATDENIYQINSADNSTKKSVSKNEWSLVMQPEGNGLFSTNKFNLEMLPDSPEDITCTYYDKGRKQLLVGTKSNGVLRYKTSPEIKLLDSKNYSTAGVSNQVTALLVDKYKRTWVGTDKGVFMDNGKKMKAYEEGTYIDEITALGPDVWILGGGVLNRVSPENRWLPGDVDARTYRGKIRDMVYDNDGKLWVASDIITRYDIIKDSVEVFDRTNGFTAKNIQWSVPKHQVFF